MRSSYLLLLSLFAFSPANAVSSSSLLSPVTRVVELLQSLAKQVEKEGQKEEDLYETYVCWGKSVVDQKTATNAAADSRISELETYIADLNAGRIELTDERSNLEKEIEELLADTETSTAMRKKEHSDFLGAEDEMTKAISALESAIEVLSEATKEHKEGVLLAVRQRLGGGMKALLEQQKNLQNAVELGKRFLTKADSLFLQRVLLGDVPTVDWKKLNRKATFKMSYKARSFKIQDVLKKMHQTFEINLKDATKKEAAAKAEYETLMEAKNGQLDTARDSLAKMDEENGARGMSEQDASDEVAALKKQVADDKEFIKETEASLATKKEEWKERQVLRAGELEAISKAIATLHNDDARDLFKKSFASQGFFLQVDMSSKQTAANGAALALKSAAQKSGDARLTALVSLLSNPDSVKTNFEPVLKAIDKMIALLKDEENKDLEIKETCESDRMSDTRKAILAARAIDEMTDKVTKLESDIAKLNEDIESLKAEHKKVQEELDAATKIRNDEHANWLVTDKDDEDAAETVKSARHVLQSFYSENNLMLAQKGKQPTVAAGEAPPPPPPTWEGGYGGKTGETTGILALLDMVHEDILSDKAKAKAEEDKSKQEYDEFKSDSESHMQNLMDEVNDKEKIKGDKETDKIDTETSRGTKKGELDATLDKINKINPNCEYFEVNYVMRRSNRHIELDGLQKAKTILEGGSFTEGPDPNREIKPGDAAAAGFLQMHRK